ncbi:hypothetical protein L3X38_024346 [Prunus dulcis]|uniref:Uncharacterized protein n=1 Tax=Prunus dulcis TaxID=3755 RepID=A0AAD4W0Q5_PRUDU|nr:hypothetical protein L3X38_024346 [Prunus dulcis]
MVIDIAKGSNVVVAIVDPTRNAPEIGHVAQNVEIAPVVPSSFDTFNSLVEVALAESSPTMTPTNSRDKAPMFQIAGPLPPFFQHFLRRVLEPAISPAFPTALQSNTFAFHGTLPTPSHI